MSTRILGGASLTCVAWFVTVAGGCGEMVSSREYIDNSMTEYAYVDRQSDVYGYAPVRPATERVIAIPNSQGQPIVYGRQGEPIREYGFYEGVITPGARSTYTSDVRNELEALERELQRIEARAEIKGAPALAAVDPKVRDFEMSRQSIADRIADADDWNEATSDIDESLENAREAVREAAEVVARTPSPTAD